MYFELIIFSKSSCLIFRFHIDEFRTFLSSLNYKFDDIALSETKLQEEPAVHISLTRNDL